MPDWLMKKYRYLVRGEEEPTEILVIADPPAARRTSEENIMNEMQKEHSKFVCYLFFSVMNDWIVLVIVPTILLLTLRF